jgi:hypothetical protein
MLSYSVGTGTSLAEYSSPFIAERKNEWISISTPSNVVMVWCLINLKENY